MSELLFGDKFIFISHEVGDEGQNIISRFFSLLILKPTFFFVISI